ncbi:hypothetical protein DPMN_005113 [Dreissena polymorpha]|uniref:Uncharacterized protein n=1 Tax=Dreissena polymorpha TaxID=45954 RepID=A0A9D4RW68_DREPO|nr:hypothetical protein DPMN_005113 [Dreissena polymorpha]
MSSPTDFAHAQNSVESPSGMLMVRRWTVVVLYFIVGSGTREAGQQGWQRTYGTDGADMDKRCGTCN